MDKVKIIKNILDFVDDAYTTYYIVLERKGIDEIGYTIKRVPLTQIYYDIIKEEFKKNKCYGLINKNDMELFKMLNEMPMDNEIINYDEVITINDETLVKYWNSAKNQLDDFLDRFFETFKNLLPTFKKRTASNIVNLMYKIIGNKKKADFRTNALYITARNYLNSSE